MKLNEVIKKTTKNKNPNIKINLNLVYVSDDGKCDHFIFLSDVPFIEGKTKK